LQIEQRLNVVIVIRWYSMEWSSING